MRRPRQSGVAGVGVLLFLVIASCSPTQRSAGPPGPPTGTQPDTYVGSEVCKECHKASFERFSHTKMGRLFLHQPRNAAEGRGCETCHGPSKAHVESDGKIVGGLIVFSKKSHTPVEERNQVCLTCHTKASKVFWKGSAHNAQGEACTSCHRIMTDVSPRSQLTKATEMETCGTCHLRERAQQYRSSHMPLREGKMTCSSCHDPHGTVSRALLKGNSINETCYSCHAEKRGPFLWEHAPVTESCVNCHNPHGSNHERMLKLATPRLCQQCHNEKRQHPSAPYGPDARNTAIARFVFGRACATCHFNIHGSNHPSGSLLNR